MDERERIYLINGWEESRSYFFKIHGYFTDEEIERLKNGEKISKGNNTYQVLNWDGI